MKSNILNTVMFEILPKSIKVPNRFRLDLGSSNIKVPSSTEHMDNGKLKKQVSVILYIFNSLFLILFYFCLGTYRLACKGVGSAWKILGNHRFSTLKCKI